ncbi:MAG: molybdopterin-synthase adenylyltransferase MoeB [Fibrobacterales bacterium]
MNLTESQIERYSRHILLNEVGVEGQEKLLNAKVLLVGAGGLGSPNALYLGAAGVGTIGIMDDDVVDLSNLQRQIIHSTAEIGRPKAESARNSIEEINPDVTVITFDERLTPDNAEHIFNQFDFVIDGTDNFASKFLIADAAHFTSTPYSNGGILQFTGQSLTVIPGETACYRCLYKEPPPKDQTPTCAEAGVLGVLAGVIGSIQATEAIKFLLGEGELLTNRLLSYDALAMRFSQFKIKKDSLCPLCGDSPIITALSLAENKCDL